MSDDNILVGIEPDLSGTKKATDALESIAVDAGKNFGQKLGDGAEKSVATGFGNVYTAALKLAAAIGGGLLFKQMIENAVEAQNAVNSLNSAMKVAGTFTDEASQKFQDYSHSLQVTTGVSDDLINQNASLLVSIGHLRGDGLERATKAALDLAATGRVEVGQAFEIMSKAATGATAGLGKLGLKISESIPESQRFAAALNMIEKNLGGLAESKINTFSGALGLLKLSFGDVLENIGGWIVKSPVVIALIKEIGLWFQKLADAAERFGKSGDVVGNLIKMLLSFADTIVQYVLPPIELLYNAGVVVWDVFKTGLQTILVLLVNVAEGWARIGNMVGIVSDDSLKSITAFADSSSGVLTQFSDNTQKDMGNLFNFDATTAAEGMVNRIQQVVDTAQPALDQMKNNLDNSLAKPALDVGDSFQQVLIGMGNAAKEFAVKASDNFNKVGASMFQAVGQGAGQAFAAFGKAVAKGDNAVNAFLASFLASMGQMAIQLGTQFILTGIAYTWAMMPNGPALIAAGAALAAFGGILSAVGGGGGSTASAGSGGGGGGGGGVSGPADQGAQTEDVATLERKKPDTNITVQVQGNILDRRQTGLELADVIQETFGTNGINYKT